LRVAINLGNSVLVQKDDAGGAPGGIMGITPELAQELGKRLGVPVAFVLFEAAGKAFEAAKADQVDIVFLANEPVRAAEIDFTAPYVIIYGNYMVPVESGLRTLADVDKPGIRIAVGPNSAYDLFLTRTLKNATIVRAEKGGGRDMIDLFLRDKLEVAAGVRQPLVAYAKDHPEVRLIDEPFMEIKQSMGTKKGRTAGAAYLRAFIEEMKASGFVADALKRSGQTATVAPPASL
jgi:polar amino acid transport system substrate-binding protein